MTARMPLIKNLNKNHQILHIVCGVARVSCNGSFWTLVFHPTRWLFCTYYLNVVVECPLISKIWTKTNKFCTLCVVSRTSAATAAARVVLTKALIVCLIISIPADEMTFLHILPQRRCWMPPYIKNLNKNQQILHIVCGVADVSCNGSG